MCAHSVILQGADSGRFDSWNKIHISVFAVTMVGIFVNYLFKTQRSVRYLQYISTVTIIVHLLYMQTTLHVDVKQTQWCESLQWSRRDFQVTLELPWY